MPTVARACAQALRRFLLALVADQQARERQGDVERVLAVVVDGVDAVEALDLAGEQPLEVPEGALEGLHGQLRPGGAEQALDRGEHRLRRTDLHGVGDVEIAAASAGHF